MVKKQTPLKKKKTEADSTYFFKLVLYIILGSLWVKFADPLYVGPVVINGFPFGLALGLLFASHDHFQIDRKIEFAVLLIVTILTYFLPAGIII